MQLWIPEFPPPAAIRAHQETQYDTRATLLNGVSRPMVYFAPASSSSSGGGGVTLDEELNLLDEAMRRLKVEYDVFFGGGSKKPPADTEWRGESVDSKKSY